LGPWFRSWPYLRLWTCLRRGTLRLGGRTYLRSWAFLWGWSWWLNRPLLGRRSHLLSWLGSLDRPFRLNGLVGRPGLWALLHHGSRDRLTPFHSKRLGNYNRLRLAAVYGNELGAVCTCCKLVLLLNSQRGQSRLPQSGQFRRARWKIHAPTTAAIAHAVVGSDIGDVADVGVVDDGGVHIRDLAVVVELVVIPVPAVIAAADIAVSVIHTTVVANVAAPITLMPPVTA